MLGSVYDNWNWVRELSLDAYLGVGPIKFLIKGYVGSQIRIIFLVSNYAISGVLCSIVLRKTIY